MSALGQKRTFASQQAMSASPPIATAKANSRKRQCPLHPRKRTCAVHTPMSALGHKRVGPFIEKRYRRRRDVEHARARALYRFRSGLLAGPAIQNNNPDHGCDYQRATESRCQCPVIYCRDLHVCRLGGAANAMCEVGRKATRNFVDPRRGSGIVMSLRGPCLHTPIDLIVGHLAITWDC